MEASIAEIRDEHEFEHDEAVMTVASFLVRTNARIIYPVPYAGDEQPTTYVRPPIIDEGFWLTKPA